jgi:hypothetical protein
MDDAVAAALERDRVVDITTTGPHTGEPRRLEIWIHHLAGRHYITGTPGPRAWYANLVAHPRFVLHLKESATADLPASARPITGDEERREVFGVLLPNLPFETKLHEWLAGSPLVEVELSVPSKT